MKKKNPIDAARRYVANAKEVIKKANYIINRCALLYSRANQS